MRPERGRLQVAHLWQRLEGLGASPRGGGGAAPGHHEIDTALM
jgi:hypothetical protein